MTLNDVIRLFELNKDNLDEACRIDDSEFKFSFSKAISILNRFKEFNSGFVDKKCIAVTNGNPYTKYYSYNKCAGYYDCFKFSNHEDI